MESEQDLFRKEDYSLHHARRQFLRFLLISPLLGPAGLISCSTMQSSRQSNEDIPPTDTQKTVTDPDSIKPFPSETAPLENFFDATNVFQFEDVARTKLTPDVFHFIADGADDLKTVQANREAFDLLQIRARRLVDVSKVDTTINILGRTIKMPIILAPVGAQQMLHQEGELASARAAASGKHLFIAAMLASFSVEEVAAVGQGPLWFQLYPSPDRTTTLLLLQRAESAGADAVVLTVDGPTRANRERQYWYRSHRRMKKPPRLGNLANLKGRLRIGDPSLTWEIINWLKSNTKMKVVIKGIVTHEDARLCVKHGADGLIVSNHGGRQEESNRGTMECLPEVVDAIDGRIPVLIDGGVRRGTDIFKALALGAQAICIGRPYLWGLATFGEDGVKKVLDLLSAELVRIMQLAGTPSIQDISSAFVKWRGCE